MSIQTGPEMARHTKPWLVKLLSLQRSAPKSFQQTPPYYPKYIMSISYLFIYMCLCVCVFIKIGEWRRSIATLVFHLNSLPSTGSCRSRCCQFYLYILPKASWLVSSVQSDVSTVLGRLPGCWLSQNSVPHRQSIFHSPTSWAAFNWQAMTNLRIMTSDVTLKTLKGIHR